MAKLFYVADIALECLDNPITVGDGKFRASMPFAGEILGNASGPRIAGHIQNAGTGVGTSTDIQVRNVTTGRDYFSTLPAFEVDNADANGRAVLSGGVLKVEPTFRAGDVLALDVDAVPTGANSAQLQVWLTVGMWRDTD